MFFCENEKYVFTIDLVRFTKLMTYLGCGGEGVVSRDAVTSTNELLMDMARKETEKDEEKTDEKAVLQLTREEVLVIAANIGRKTSPNPLPPYNNIYVQNQPVQPTQIEIIPSPNEDKKFKERAIVSVMVLVFITEEFSFKTAYEEYFRF
jgi:hypothetical protein